GQRLGRRPVWSSQNITSSQVACIIGSAYGEARRTVTGAGHVLWFSGARLNKGQNAAHRDAHDYEQSGSFHKVLFYANDQHQRWEPAAHDSGTESQVNGWLPSAACCGWASSDSDNNVQAILSDVWSAV